MWHKVRSAKHMYDISYKLRSTQRTSVSDSSLGRPAALRASRSCCFTTSVSLLKRSLSSRFSCSYTFRSSASIAFHLSLTRCTTSGWVNSAKQATCGTCGRASVKGHPMQVAPCHKKLWCIHTRSFVFKLFAKCLIEERICRFRPLDFWFLLGFSACASHTARIPSINCLTLTTTWSMRVEALDVAGYASVKNTERTNLFFGAGSSP